MKGGAVRWVLDKSWGLLGVCFVVALVLCVTLGLAKGARAYGNAMHFGGTVSGVTLGGVPALVKGAEEGLKAMGVGGDKVDSTTPKK